MLLQPSPAPHNRIAKRIGFFHDGFNFAGMETFVLLLAKYLDPQRYTPLVLLPDYYYEYPTQALFREALTHANIPFIKTPIAATPGRLGALRRIIRLGQFIEQQQLDLVHIHSIGPFSAQFVLMAGVLARRVVVRTEHLPAAQILGYQNNQYNQHTQRIYDFLTARIITVSEVDRQERIRLLHSNPAKVYRSHCGIELARFRPQQTTGQAKQALGLNPDLPTIGMIGRLDEQKGHTYLIQAVRIVINAYGPIQLLLVGGGGLEAALRTQVVELGLTEYVHFAGLQADPLPYLRTFDLAVIPSIFESFGLVLTEYMAMAKPIVASDLPCFREIVTAGDSALLVPAKDPSALATALLTLLRDPVLATYMGQQAHQRVHSAFSIQRLAADMMALYDSVGASGWAKI